MRFLPTNFARARKAEDSASTDVTSLSIQSKSSSHFEDLMKQVRACARGAWGAGLHVDWAPLGLLQAQGVGWAGGGRPCK